MRFGWRAYLARWRVRISVGFTLGFVALTCGAAEIRWDEWGVPHIHGRDQRDAIFGFGWAQMRANANAQLKLYIQARGQAAEVFGAGDHDSEIDSDMWRAKLAVVSLAQAWWKSQTQTEKQILASFAAGMNAYVSAHPDEIDSRLKGAGPITEIDVLARLIDLSLYSMAVNVDQANTVASSWLRGDAKSRVHELGKAASNGWAIGPSRTSGAKSILLINPHLPWSDDSRMFEAEIDFGDVRVHGATFLGLPFIAVGFNSYLGWTHTFNPMHSFYFYELKLRPGGYLWNGQTRPFAKRTAHVKVRRLAGMYMQDKAVEVKSSVHGPVLAEKDDKALALWVPGQDAPHAIDQYWRMAEATNFDEFKSAISQLQLPVFSIIYADRDGRIYYNFGGRNPTGPAAVYRRDDVLDGTTDKALWTGTLPLDSLPFVVDPPSGWLQNANDPPWTVTWPRALQEKHYPPGLIHSEGNFTNLRAQYAIKQFLAPRRFTLEDIVALKHHTHVELADRVLDDLIAAGRRSKDPDARAAAEVLTKWDRNIDTQSRGASLFVGWALLTYGDKNLFAAPFDPKNPITTPLGLQDTALAANRLGRAARIVRELEGKLDEPWGTNHRLRWSDDHDAPANGGPDPLGMPRTTYYAPDIDHGGFTAVGGDGFVAIVAFGEQVIARGLLSYGNFTQKAPAGVKDQLPLYSREQVREIPFGANDKLTTVLAETTP